MAFSVGLINTLFCRRPVDMDNNWNRVACNVTNHPLSEDLYMRLMSEGFKEDFISYLPLDSLFQEGINISRKDRACV